MVRRSFASRFSKLEETVCANVSGLLVKQKLLATMKSEQGCPTKWVELKRPHFHTGFSHAGWDRSPIHRSVEQTWQANSNVLALLQNFDYESGFANSASP